MDGVGTGPNAVRGWESIEMLGIIDALRESSLSHSHAAHTRRSPAMRVKPAMEVEEMPDAASSPGAPCSRGDGAFCRDSGP
jgi:hypothetical protein